ncbi:LysR family transcriptional regulator [Ralstonia solanacearum]|uniref:LysR family transcriptional regulator n=1 Tax=Ralstonia solanacearum TaxID=305 RepID=UPI0012A028A2|nr:LysR family transcriptional regulator [Ralstonia solanacearum]AYB63425.1 LysR family transcriptional regulator [Ralstonia solanacearum]
MRKDIPNPGALQALEAAARLASCPRAADELALTQSAVGRQVAALERRLGVQLSTRVRRRLALTDVGREYAARIRRHLEQIQRDTLELSAGRQMGYILEIAVVPTFATHWLIPRLTEFARLRPDITVNLASRTLAFSFQECAYDAAIYFGDQFWPDTKGSFLFAEGPMVPVCSPACLEQHDLSSEAGFAKCRHLHLSSRAHAWRDWYTAQGWNYTVGASRGPRHELHTMVVAAAVAGLGIGLVPRFLIEMELETGQLVIPVERSLEVAQGYYFAHPESVKASDALSTFEQWILSLAR